MKVFEWLETVAGMMPEHLALVDASGSLTYGQLLHRLKYNQRLLLDQGYQPGTRVMVATNSQMEFILHFLSLLSIGCWVIPLPSGMSSAEIQSVSNRTEVVICPNGLLGVSSPVPPGPIAEFFKPDEEQTGIYHLTSGTTDMPKLCVRSLQALAAEGESYRRTFHTGPEDKLLSAAPMYHSYALGAGLIAGLTAGMTIYTVDGFVPRTVLRIVEECQITCLILVPAMARALANTYARHVYDLSSLQTALVGAGPITEEMYTRFKERFGIALLSNYGSTETGGIISRLEPLPFASIGKPMWGVEIKLCDSQGRRVVNGEAGELRIRTASMLSGYFGMSGKPLDDEGYFSMGDLVQQDDDGYLYIKGRTKLMINVGGKKVNPYEIEGILNSCPGVRECAVVGIPKPNGEEAVKAYIVAENHVTEDEIRKFCFEHLTGHKLPGRIERVSSLPRNHVGKIMREELRKG